MTGSILEGLREIGQYRNLIAIGVPLLGGALVLATSIFLPRGKAKGLLTGSYMLLASVGASFLLCGVVALVAGEPAAVTGPLFLLGIVLTVLMGIFSPEVIRGYQQFEFRKLAAEIFRRS